MMKIGIMTHCWSQDNYGQILQCYALQKYLLDAGHEVYIINYNYQADFIKTKYLDKISIKKIVNALIWRTKKVRDIINHRLHDRQFNKFRSAYIRMSGIYNSYEELQINPPDADIYITGSDQVWGFTGFPVDITKNHLEAFFLNFGDKKIRRMSYSSSFGANYIHQEHYEVIRKLLARYEYVSVREKSGVKICNDCNVENPEWVRDPVLLLTADEYQKLYRKENTIYKRNKYCLLYLLGHESKFDKEKLFKWAKDNHMEVMYVTANSMYDRKKKLYPTIQEWLYLIDNAEYIITNSYHGTLFSLLFHKKFGIIELKGKNADMNERLVSLFEFFDIPLHYFDNNIENIYAAIDFYKIDNLCKHQKILDIINNGRI